MNCDNEQEHICKKAKIYDEVDVFILNLETIDKYEYTNPYELIIINTSYEYSIRFHSALIEGNIKTNVKKIITTDSIIVKYFSAVNNIFKKIFPNCDKIQINTFENYFMTLIKIIDDFEIVKYFEYNLDNNIYTKNSIKNYRYFSDFILTGDLSNIKYIKIKNKITHKTDCHVEKKIILNIINKDIIVKKNIYTYELIMKNNIESKYINNTYLQYIDVQNSIFIEDDIINVKQCLYFRDGYIL